MFLVLHCCITEEHVICYEEKMNDADSSWIFPIKIFTKNNLLKTFYYDFYYVNY